MLALLIAPALKADTQQSDRVIIDAVEIHGLDRVNEQLIRSQIEGKAGQPYSRTVVSRDIIRLYELGFFTHIKADTDDSNGRFVVIYTFEEERSITDVRIIGNKKVKDRPILGVLTWREGDSFVEEGYDEERGAVLDLYRSKGFINATVDIIVEETAPARVRITYVINEGRKAKIKKIRFEGNQALSTGELRDAVKTRRALWFLGGRYKEEKFEVDLFNVIEAYGDVGRLEAEIAATDFEYTKNGKGMFITIFINEGPEYRIESIEIANNFVFSDEELTNNLTVFEGEVHKKSAVNEDSDTMRKRYRDNGYINAQAQAQVTLNRERKTTSIVHQIFEDELKYIRQVNITGNSVTKDEVIRRGILLDPGERFDGSLLRASEQRLGATQYFESLRLNVEDVQDNDRFTDLNVDVEEGKTGNFNFGAAFNSDEGVVGFGELRLNNFDIMNWPSFSGGGQQFSSRFSIGTVRTNARISFTDPELFGYPVSFGVDLFNERFQTRGGTDFTQETTGAQIRLSKRLSNYVTGWMSMGYADVSITNLDTFVAPALRELEDPGSTAAITLGLTRNTANDFRDPDDGARHELSLSIAGLGADNDFVKMNHDTTWYFGFNRWKKVSFLYRTREGVGVAYGDKEFIPFQERYFAGGSSTIRGYDFREVGPKAQTFRIVNGQVIIDEEAIGGELRILNTIEAKYKLNDLLRLYTFVDGGGVWFKPEDIDLSALRFSVGIGIGLQVPLLGPIRIDYGYPLNPDDDQGNGRIHLQSSLLF